MNEFYNVAIGPVQLNNQVTYRNAVADACDILSQSLANTSNSLAALGAAAMSLTNQTDCYAFSFNASAPLLILGNPSQSRDMFTYLYQCCTQGFVVSSEMTSTGAKGTAFPAWLVDLAEIRAECMNIYGNAVPELAPPTIATNFTARLADVGGIVFTNGDLDEWSGGGITEVPAGMNNVAVVIYPNASHCTDTHNYNWNNTAEPAVYAQLRASAMDQAAGWMEAARVPAASVATSGGWRSLGLRSNSALVCMLMTLDLLAM